MAYKNIKKIILVFSAVMLLLSYPSTEYTNADTAATAYNDMECAISLKKPTDAAAERQVLVSGESLGIAMMTNGLIVTKVTEVSTKSKSFFPAADAGIRAGDILLELNGNAIEDSKHLASFVNDNGNKAITVKYKRKTEEHTTTVIPRLDKESSEYKLGLLVRDSTSGIGTLTFVDPKTNAYGALGHAITDSSTGNILPVKNGIMTKAIIKNIIKGKNGAPGELQGDFVIKNAWGSIVTNNEFGIFGKITDTEILNTMKLMPVASRKDVKEGDAVILCTLNDGEAEYYNIKITKVNSQHEPETKGLVIEVTDERLLEITGGIVQGMSGSPIIQDGRLVGAVTHVMINDPQKGYGIYADWMLNETDKLAA